MNLLDNMRVTPNTNNGRNRYNRPPNMVNGQNRHKPKQFQRNKALRWAAYSNCNFRMDKYHERHRNYQQRGDSHHTQFTSWICGKKGHTSKE